MMEGIGQVKTTTMLLDVLAIQHVEVGVHLVYCTLISNMYACEVMY